MGFISDFRTELASDAEKLIHEVLPQKVSHLDKLLDNELLSLQQVEKVRKCSWDSWKQAGAANTATKGSGSDKFESNQIISDVIDIIRPELTSIMQSCNIIRLWVTLLLPQMEDGNNFGVSVQEETVAEIRGVECEATAALGEIFLYFTNRAGIAAKLLKHPQVKDFMRYVVEEDERQFVSLRATAAQIRNSYSLVQDQVLKNLEKIKTPKSRNFDSLY